MSHHGHQSHHNQHKHHHHEQHSHTSGGVSSHLPLDPQYKRVLLDYGEFNSKIGARHRGVDIYAPDSTAVHAIKDGIVFDNHKANSDHHWDACLIIKSGSLYIYYAHISSKLHKNHSIKEGDVIGTVNLSHLHISVNTTFKYYWGYSQTDRNESLDHIERDGWLRFQDVMKLYDYKRS